MPVARLYPIFAELAGRDVLVVGGGAVAELKVAALLESAARVTVGAPVFTDEIDIANARIRFANGCVADVTASRISLKAERKLRVFQADAYLSIDLQQKLLSIVRKPAVIAEGALPKVDLEERSFEQGDALADEIRSFVDAVRHGRRPVVSGEDGLRALETATRIAELVGRGSTAAAG